jgi:hypothetical protein
MLRPDLSLRKRRIDGWCVYRASAVSALAASAATGLLLLFATPAVSGPAEALQMTLAESHQLEADQVNHEGIVAQDRHDLVASIRTFERARDLSTNDDSVAIIRQNIAISYSLQGKEAYDRGDHAGAAGLFKQALAQRLAPPDEETLRYNIGQTYYRAAREAHDRRDLARELDLLDAAVEYDRSGARRGWLDRVRDEIIERQETIESIKLADIGPEATAPVRRQPAASAPAGGQGAPAGVSSPVIVPPGAVIPLVTPFGARRIVPQWQGPRVVQMPQRAFMPRFSIPQRAFVPPASPFVGRRR